jgi:hypothetical protein
MLERRRQAKTYHVLPTDEEVGLVNGEEDGVELSERDTEIGATEETARAPTIEQELDNWDEHAEDAWDDPELHEAVEAHKEETT